jgi:hypothetical protein
MKTVLLAAAAALLLGVGSAQAGDGSGPIPNTEFTELPGVIAQAPVQDNDAYATNQKGANTFYATKQQPTVVFPWNSRD